MREVIIPTLITTVVRGMMVVALLKSLSVEDNIPLRKKKFTNKNLQPWYSDRLRKQKRMVHRRESIWKKYGAEHQWKASQADRSRYNRMLNAVRTEYFRKEFEQHKVNMKHLYKLMAKLTGCTSVNLLPEIDSYEWLAEDFADYFLNKIVKIRDDLNQYGKFVVESHDHVKELQATVHCQKLRCIML